MVNNKKHWYDGKIYDKFIAPNQDLLFKRIKKMIEPGSKILDVGCGTGRLDFQLADKCTKITGIDLSIRNIELAKFNLKESKFQNIEFIHMTAQNIYNITSDKYDYAIITYVLHEMPPQERLNVIKVIKSVSNKIIIGDYQIPLPKNYFGWMVQAVEFIAGKDHFANFKSYERNGGIEYLLQKAGLKETLRFDKMLKTVHLVVVE